MAVPGEIYAPSGKCHSAMACYGVLSMHCYVWECRECELEPSVSGLSHRSHVVSDSAADCPMLTAVLPCEESEESEEKTPELEPWCEMT